MATYSLQKEYPWTTPDTPFIVSAPMMRITMAKHVVAVSKAGGFGFLAAGFDLSNHARELQETADQAKAENLPLHDGVLPIGIGYQNWGADLQLALQALEHNPVAAVWLFGSNLTKDLLPWVTEIRKLSGGKTKIWVQIGTVADAIEVAKTLKPDVIVVQGADNGGHGLAGRASIIALLPEIADTLQQEGFNIPLLAAGGIADGRGVAAALSLGADGVCLGTRFLACHEAVIMKGYQDEVLRATDGGLKTVTTRIYDTVRGIVGWPSTYRGRALSNKTLVDHLDGMTDEDNYKLYQEEMKKGDSGWGPDGRMTTYAGTCVGLVKEVKSAAEIVSSLQTEAVQVLEKTKSRYHT